MAQRIVFVQPPPVDCGLGNIGDNQAYDACPTKIGHAVRAVFRLSNGVNPFLTLANLQSEVVWDAVLALNTTDTPDNLFLTTKIFEFSQTAGELTPIESTSTGDVFTGSYADDVVTMSYAFLDSKMGNDLMASLRDNSKNLEVMFVVKTQGTGVARIRCGVDSTGLIPLWIPVRHAAFSSRTIETDRNAIESHTATLRFEPEVLQNAEFLVTPAFDILKK